MSQVELNITQPDIPTNSNYYSSKSIEEFLNKTSVEFDYNMKSSKESKRKFTNNGFGISTSVSFDYSSYKYQFYYTQYQHVYTKVMSLPE